MNIYERIDILWLVVDDKVLILKNVAYALVFSAEHELTGWNYTSDKCTHSVLP